MKVKLMSCLKLFVAVQAHCLFPICCSQCWSSDSWHHRVSQETEQNKYSRWHHRIY